MSVTYTCKRVANAFRSGEKTIFVLGEVTYESNVYPHTKSFSTVFIGELRDAIQQIFAFAGDTCGGALNSPDRNMTPERYIKSWLNAIKQPYFIDPEVNILPASFYSWNKEAADKIRSAIQERGTAPTLANHYDLLADHGGLHFLPTTFTDEGHPLVEYADSSLGYHPKKSSGEPALIMNQCLRLPASREPYYLVLDGEGRMREQPEWEYRVMSAFVSYIWETELTHPGSYRKLIQDFREHLHDLEVCDPDSVLVRLAHKNRFDYAKLTIDELIGRYGAEPFPLSMVMEDDRYYINSYAEFSYVGKHTETPSAPVRSPGMAELTLF